MQPLRGVLAGILLFATVPAYGIEFRSIAEPAVVLFDAPSKQSTKLFILSKDYPVEVIITSEGWVRIRDDTGAFGWVEAKSLSARRTVMVKSQAVDARDRPIESAPVVFKAAPGVILEYLGLTGGWAQVRHRDGATGYVLLAQLWGV